MVFIRAHMKSILHKENSHYEIWLMREMNVTIHILYIYVYMYLYYYIIYVQCVARIFPPQLKLTDRKRQNTHTTKIRELVTPMLNLMDQSLNESRLHYVLSRVWPDIRHRAIKSRIIRHIRQSMVDNSAGYPARKTRSDPTLS